MSPVRIPLESFPALRLPIARWLSSRKIAPTWTYKQPEPYLVIYFHSEDLAYEFLLEFDDR